MGIENAIFNRLNLLLGEETMERVRSKRVIIFGVGGVGSWCAESLVRSGISHLTIVDSDRVCITNVNRQLQATTKTVGQVKVEVLKERLLEINPEAEINAMQEIYSAENAEIFQLETYDYIIDAIDSLKDKVHLILHASSCQGKLFSAMGAALKMDPTQVRVAEFWEVEGCPLARAIRKRLKKMDEYPAKKFLCVFSPEVLPNKGTASACGTSACMCPKAIIAAGNPDLINHEWCSSKAQINGTTAHITAIFGFTIAGLVMQDLYNASN
ncbi:MAG: tRNA threonylcarbamoyladenosine dehydratase [Bacteroidales bacterium]|nr:tRNA threonylcarbamoyladenosine dehydratase [Bacteroidales bacterium]